jgi:hypothetical protein
MDIDVSFLTLVVSQGSLRLSDGKKNEFLFDPQNKMFYVIHMDGIGSSQSNSFFVNKRATNANQADFFGYLDLPLTFWRVKIVKKRRRLRWLPSFFHKRTENVECISHIRIGPQRLKDINLSLSDIENPKI